MSNKDTTMKRPTPPPGGPHGAKMMQKPKDFKGTWKKIIRFSKEHVKWIVVALLISMLGTILTIIGPEFLRRITDILNASLVGDLDIDAVSRLAGFLVIIYCISAAFNYIQGFIMATVSQNIGRKLRSNVGTKINKLPLKYFDKNSYGDVLSRITNDIDTVAHSLNQSVGTIVSAITMLIGTLIMMLVTNVILALVAIFTSIIGFILMAFIISKSQKHFKNQQQALGLLNGHVEEMYSGHLVIKAFNGGNKSISDFNKINERLYSHAWKAQFISGLMMPLMGFIGNLGYVAVCIVGAVLVLNGTISFGVIVAFMIYVRLFTTPLSQLGQAATQLQSTAAASERIFELLEEPELKDEKEQTNSLLSRAAGDIHFKNVQFGYSEDKLIIKNFNFHVTPGQKIAIVGPTGAGKTTLVNLLMRFYELNAGEIYLDGVPYAKLTRENIHDQFCMVLQDTWLFEGTIRENLVFNKENISDDVILQACKLVGLEHFIQSLPNGLDTVLHENTAVSIGQKQLLTIARAMIKDAPLLILDEATSSVDTRTEVLIQEAMDRLLQGRTSFIIAHRLSTIKNADVIIVMKDGDIIETGSHNELMEQKGFYANLYNSQFESLTS